MRGTKSALSVQQIGQIRQVRCVLLNLGKHQTPHPGHLSIHQFLDFMTRLLVTQGGGQADDQDRRNRHETQQSPAQGRDRGTPKKPQNHRP